jgi:hypothetical protein
MGRMIPAGTGMQLYRDTFIKGDFFPEEDREGVD